MAEPQISDEAAIAAAQVMAGVDQYREVGTAWIDCARRALAAAVPHLHQQWEAELRAEIADEIAAKRPAGGDQDDANWGDFIAHACYSAAARIARGAQPGGQPE